MARLLGTQPGAARLLRHRRAGRRTRDVAARSLDHRRSRMRDPRRGAWLSRAGSDHQRRNRARPLPRRPPPHPGSRRTMGVATRVRDRPTRPPPSARRAQRNRTPRAPSRARRAERSRCSGPQGRRCNHPRTAPSHERPDATPERGRHATPPVAQAACTRRGPRRSSCVARARSRRPRTNRRCAEVRPGGPGLTRAMGATPGRARTGAQTHRCARGDRRCRPHRVAAAAHGDP